MPPAGVLIVGCGYSGLAIARLLVKQGIPVVGTTRDPARFSEIQSTGALPHLFQSQSARKTDQLPIGVDHAVICVGPPWNDPYDPTEDLARALLPLGLKRVVYLSSTSVYGDKQGAWVDEDSECTPSSSAGRRRLAAENVLLSLAKTDDFPVVITRLPGIYGPQRSLLDRIRSGRFRLIAGQDSYSNRIHVDDLARGVMAALELGQTGRIYLITDNHPALLSEVAHYCAGLLHQPLPPPLSVEEANTELEPSRRSLLMDNKRLRNDRLRTELGVNPLFPSYLEGIRSIWEADEHPSKAGPVHTASL